MPTQFEVQRKSFDKARVSELPDRSLAPDEARLRIDFFAFTANNLTYAVAGDMLGYWQFFPPLGGGDEWGVIPVWGYADVTELGTDAEATGLAVGDRLYGYFPPAQELIMQPVNVKQDSLFDGAAHRQSLPPLYNRYERVPASTDVLRSGEIAKALFGPLYMTGFCIFDQLKENDWYGAEQVLIISASSKTSLGVAYGFPGAESAPAAIGLTSASNATFVDGLGIYSQTVTYDDLSSIPKKPSVIVDMAGNSELASKLENMLGDDLRYYLSVGLTHWDQNTGGLAGADGKREMFFAPSYMLARAKALPPGQFAALVAAHTQSAAEASMGWLQLDKLEGLEKLAEEYPAVHAGKINPKRGLVFQM